MLIPIQESLEHTCCHSQNDKNLRLTEGGCTTRNHRLPTVMHRLSWQIDPSEAAGTLRMQASQRHAHYPP
eukprot:755156-Hanusia_phi.AAC.3